MKKELSILAKAMMEKLGLTEDEYRQMMSERSRKADRTNSYFKTVDPDTLKEIASRGGKGKK